MSQHIHNLMGASMKGLRDLPYVPKWKVARAETLLSLHQNREAMELLGKMLPKLELPDAAVEEARRLGKTPDTLYSLELLDATGICVVPGSGFGQKDGEHHYRLTCLCPGVEEYVSALENFHRKFVAKYGGL